MIKNRFVLIDAFALIFRAYYAIPPTLTRENQQVGAVYGFASALLSAIKTLDPEYIAVGMDVGKPTHRHIEYKEYKAKRPEAPKELTTQIPYVIDLLKVMDIPTYGVEGFEGEDIIATIVAKVKAQSSNVKLEYIIVTGDMDLLQLIDSEVKVYSMARGVNQAVLYDKERVKERYGLTPQEFVDYKALRGDPSDNIPGVRGIGEKTAIKLIQEYGSIEKLYKTITNDQLPMINQASNSENYKIEKMNGNWKLKIGNLSDDKMQKISDKLKISKKIITILIDNVDQALLSYKLSKIRNDAPLDFKLSSAKVNHYDKDKTVELFQKLGFKSLISRLPEEIKPQNNQQKLF
jgi:DNA polymerase-1